MDIKLLVVDIDGTIAGKSNQVSRRVREVIEAVQNKGIGVAIATGRMYCSALPFHRSIGSHLPVLAYNGAWVQNPLTGEIHQHLPLDTPIALQLLDYLEQPELIDRVGVHFYVEDRLYVRKILPETEGYATRSGVEAIAVGDLGHLLEEQVTTKVLALCRDPEIMEFLKEDLPKRFPRDGFSVTQSNRTFLEAISPQANKGQATRYLAENILGLERSNVMAIGDNFNDAEMLQYAGLAVGMANGPTRLQSLVDWVAPDVEEDGAAVAIEKFLLP